MDGSRVRVVSFDCAQTLVAARWVPPLFAVECAEAVGCAVHRERAAQAYAGILQRRWPEFQQLNLQRSAAICDGFWRSLTAEWLEAIGATEWLEPVLLEAERKLYHTSDIFESYDDVVPCLTELKRRGYRLAVLSNWDVSLHRVLAGFDLTPWFEVVLASLEEGVEKPDPRLFAILCERLGCEPGEVLHVGDDVGDDLNGARGAGMQALLLDRAGGGGEGYRLGSLMDLLEILP